MRLLDLAPHCTVPPLDGADRRGWHLYEAMIQKGIEGRFIGRKIVADGLAKPTVHTGEIPSRDGKMAAALLSLLSGSDYWQFKMLTPAVRKLAAAGTDFDTVICNFLYSLPLLRSFRGRRIRLVVDTHNYDPAFFGSLGAAAGNPITRYLCGRAVRNSRRSLARLPVGTVMVHVSEADATAYRQDRPDLVHHVVENGCRVQPRTTIPTYDRSAPRQLIFVGSLSAQINQDALRHFAQRYWPQLRDLATLCVVGSKPPPAITELCTAQGWKLRANVSEAELEEQYEAAHFALLPFAYGAGSKLKLMEACGRGVPMLATPLGVTGVAAPPPLVQVSDDPATWRKIVEECSPPSAAALEETMAFANHVSWPELAGRFARILTESPLFEMPGSTFS